MVIDRIEAFPLHYPEPHDSGNSRYVTLVKLTTADGLVGWGECICQFPEAALATRVIVDAGLAPLLTGQDPRDVERLWQAMRDRSWWYGNGGIAAFAISAIDMALWDVKGKALGVPLYDLLGGRRAKLRACASVIFDTEDLAATHAEFAGYVARGYTAVKGGWGKSRATSFGLDPARDLRVVSTIRDAIGPKVDFVVDVGTHVHWTSSHAIKMARAFEAYDLFWIEEPLPQDDIDGYVRLRRAVATPIAAGEKEWTLRAFKALIDAGAVDIVMPDAGKAEGVTGCKKIIDLAAAHGVRFTPHSWSSAINTAAAAHLFASAANGVVFELKPNPSPMQHELVRDPIVQVDGYVTLPNGPGLGIAVVEDVVQRYLMR
ncbi:MAG: mandelate racemase/muconate lactonizing enzyme family protein [Alphaproteobacteria bacterium]|nr:mandelate racemase/muconate lactonizing enzyme family protein [Alphaproteobacteria bacterium]